MLIISHRGYWKSHEEQNSVVAFERSLSSGFGIETDIRDYRGELVISHGVADDNSMKLEQFFQIYNNYQENLPLALNVKADGLQEKLKALIEKYRIKNYFVFDMSLPEGLNYLKHQFNTFTRQSEYEPAPLFYDKACGVWADCFHKDWIDEKTIQKHLKAGKKIAFISPEIHKREPHNFWKKLAKMPVIKSKNMILCTDLPEEARRFFHEKSRS